MANKNTVQSSSEPHSGQAICFKVQESSVESIEPFHFDDLKISFPEPEISGG